MDVSGFKQVATIYYKAILYSKANHGQDMPKHGSVTAVGVKKAALARKKHTPGFSTLLNSKNSHMAKMNLAVVALNPCLRKIKKSFAVKS